MCQCSKSSNTHQLEAHPSALEQDKIPLFVIGNLLRLYVELKLYIKCENLCIKYIKNDKNFYEKSVYTHPVKGGQNDIKFRQKKSVFQV